MTGIEPKPDGITSNLKRLHWVGCGNSPTAFVSSAIASRSGRSSTLAELSAKSRFQTIGRAWRERRASGPFRVATGRQPSRPGGDGRPDGGPVAGDRAARGEIEAAGPKDAFSVFLGLLLHDLQVQVLVGAAAPPDGEALRRRAEAAAELFLRLYGPRPG